MMNTAAWDMVLAEVRNPTERWAYAFDEAKHPRDAQGRWAEVGATLTAAHPFPGDAPKLPPGTSRPDKANDPQIKAANEAHAAHQAAFHRAYTAAAIHRLLNEPHKLTPLPAPDATPERRRALQRKAKNAVNDAQADMDAMGPEFQKHQAAVAASHPEGRRAHEEASLEARKRLEAAKERLAEHKQANASDEPLPDWAESTGIKSWKDAKKKGVDGLLRGKALDMGTQVAQAASNWINGSIDSAAKYVAAEIVRQTAIQGGRGLALNTLANAYTARANGATEPGQRQRFEATAQALQNLLSAKAIDSEMESADPLQAIPHGEARRVEGFEVRRTGPNEFRMETKGRATIGDAGKIRERIQREQADEKVDRKRASAAIERASQWTEPSWMDAGKLEEESAAFQSLPNGARVVSLEEGTHGRLGSIVRHDGENRVQLDGEAGLLRSTFVEPLDVKHSWRVEKKAPAPRPVQAMLFDRGGDEGGRWITIGAVEGEDGKKHGGSPVYIKNGRIEKGHASLVGRKIDALKEAPEPEAKPEAEGKTSGGLDERKAEIERLKKEHRAVLATPLMSEGNLSPAQLGMMSKRQRKAYDENRVKKQDILEKIKALSRTDEQIANDESAKQKAAADAERRRDQARFDLLSQFEPTNFHGIQGSKKAYRKEYDELKAKLEGKAPPEQKLTKAQERGAKIAESRRANKEQAAETKKTWGARAEEAGINKDHLYQLAGDFKAHNAAYVADHTRMLAEARDIAKGLGYTGLQGLSGRQAFGNLDPSKVKGFDDVAARMMAAYPEYLGNDANEAESRLWDMLIAGNPEPMSDDQAYQQAFDHFRELQDNGQYDPDYDPEAALREEEDAVPFARAALEFLYDRIDWPEVYEGDFRESDHPRDATGKFTTGAGGSGSSKAAAGLKALAGAGRAASQQAGKLEHAGKQWLQDHVKKLPKPVRYPVLGAWAAVRASFVTYTAAQKMVKRAALRNGLSEHDAEALTHFVAKLDLIGAKAVPAGLSAIGLGGFGLIGSLVPIGSLGYLAYSTAPNPMKTAKAANRVIRKVLGKAMAGHYERTELLEDLAAKLAEHSEAGRGDWYLALLFTAANHSSDLAEILELADTAIDYAEQPDQYERQDDAALYGLLDAMRGGMGKAGRVLAVGERQVEAQAAGFFPPGH